MYMPIMLILVTVAWLAVIKIFFHATVSWTEAAIQFAIASIIMALVFFAGTHSQTADVLFENGVITKLEPRQKSCPMRWSDYTDSHCTEYRTRVVSNGQTCTTNSKGIRTCTPRFKTQYKYNYSWEKRYFVHSTVGNFEVSRTDRQGAVMPSYFAGLGIDDGVASVTRYTNYIKGAASTLHREDVKDEDDVVIAYPSVDRYFRSNRFIATGVRFSSEDWKDWNKDLMAMNSALRETGGNVIIVATGHQRSFAEMLRRAWHAHNINDVVVVIGTDGTDIAWVDVSSWSSNNMVEILIRDGILSLEALDREHINSIVYDAMIDGFELQSMDKFEYLADDIAPPTWVYVIAFIVLLIGNPALTYFFHRN